ncbi:RNA-binding transcriptional accessory protein [Chloroflexia bacterium SDU3-3]|nr:RNA-binding transcriptional accessory protein [Chloroflexia bacterium SDU3-3]
MQDSTAYAQQIARALGIRAEQALATIALLDDGNTVPFIARYRKERTGGLDEEQIRQVGGQIETLRATDERRDAVIASIEEQGKLTPELRQQLLAAATRTEIEDIYLPYRPKRRTRASIAREKGLAPLADMILQQARVGQTPEQLAAPFVGEAVPSAQDALAGARDIVAEAISDSAEVRRATREKAMQWAVLRCEKIDKAEDSRGTYQTYYAFEGMVGRLRPHQILAINRGEEEKVLRVAVDVKERDWRSAVERTFRADSRSPMAQQLALAIDDAATRLLLPAIERDVRSTLAEAAGQHAIGIFATNLRGLLTQPPIAGQVVLGIDPGFRTGCKVAVVDPTGRLLDIATIYPHEPQRRADEALKILRGLIARHGVGLITIGNGTASRETEQLVAGLTRGAPVRYLIVNEAGASVYSASPLARAEFPELDVSLRGAVSIARRAQDPLAELVKIDPQSIGVGMYQHDLDQPKLAQALGGVVETVVNQVGVDVNTASPALLRHIAGIGPKLAERIVEHRNTNGPFETRVALKKVSGLGPKAFEQSAGFLRVPAGKNPLDASAIHPESYRTAEEVLRRAGLPLRSSPAERKPALDALLAQQPLEQLASELGTGVPTLRDIFEQLVRPGRDPRADLPAPLLRSDVLSMDDLLPGMRLKGTVRNVVDFGAFVDIGVKQDGLLHASQIPRGTVLGVGDVIEVEIQRVEAERKRIALAWVRP